MLFLYHLPFEKGVALNLNNFEFPSLKDTFVSSLVEIGPLILEKKIIKFRQCFFATCISFIYYQPLEKAVTLLFNKFELPSPKDALCQVLP